MRSTRLRSIIRSCYSKHGLLRWWAWPFALAWRCLTSFPALAVTLWEWHQLEEVPKGWRQLTATLLIVVSAITYYVLFAWLYGHLQQY